MHCGVAQRPNKDVRCLAMKLLYEVVRQNTEYKKSSD